MKRLFAAAFAALAACAPAPAPTSSAASDFSSCAAAKPAIAVTDRFLEAFNAKDMPALEKTFHFPHVRLASYPIQVLTGPGQQDDVFGTLKAEGWVRSNWLDRRIIQCGPNKAHLLATFIRIGAEGKEYARYDGLYIIEYRDGFWGVTARSTFAP